MQTRAERRAYVIVSLAVLAVTLVPILCVRFAPLLDYPNHLARAYVLHHLDDVPAFARFYESAWGLMPNLGMDAVLAALLPVFDLESASRVFLVLLVLLTHTGAHVLARELHGRRSWLAPLAAFFFFSYGFFLGFTSYIMGVAMFYFALTAWLRWWRTTSLAALVLSCVLVFLAYLTHLSAFAFFALAIGATLVLRLRATPLKRVLLALLPLLMPVLVHLTVIGQVGSGGISWDGPLTTLHFVTAQLRTYDAGWDLVFLIGFFGALIVAARVSRRPVSRPALVIGGALGLAFLVAPTWYAGSWAAFRFVLPAAVLVFLAFELDLALRPVRWAYAFALAVLVVRTASITSVWLGLDTRIAGYVDAMEHIPQGARVARVELEDAMTSDNYQRSFHHIVEYAAIYREAVPEGLFTGQGKQPIVRKPLATPITRRPGAHVAPEAVDWPGVFASYDVLWLWRPPAAYQSYLAAHCASVAKWDEAVIYGDCSAR